MWLKDKIAQYRQRRARKYLEAHPGLSITALRSYPEVAARAVEHYWEMEAARGGPSRETFAYPGLNQLGYAGMSPQVRTVPKPASYMLRVFSEKPPARRAINAISNPILDLPFQITLRRQVYGVTETPKPTQDQLRRIIAATDMLERPNDDQNGREFLEMVLEDIIVLGAGAVEVEDNSSDNRPLFLWPVDAQSIRINAAWQPGSRMYRYSQGSGYFYSAIGTTDEVQLKDSELMYVKLNPRPSTPFGFGYLECAFDTVNAFLGAFDFATRRASNSTPQFGIFLGENVTSDQALRFRHYWENEVEGYGKIPIVAGGRQPSVFQFAAAGTDPLWLQYQEWLVRIIAMAFGISPMRLSLERDVNRSCYSEDTETLTIDGWKTLDQLTVDDKVASYNPYSHTISYCEPDFLHVADYTGDMIHFTSQNVDVLVTPDHRMFSRNVHSNTKKFLGLNDVMSRDDYTIRPAEELENETHFFNFRCSVSHTGEERGQFTLPGCKVYGGPKGDYSDRTFAMDTWLKFIGYWVSEGHAKRYGKGTWKVNLCQREDSDCVDDMESVIQELPFEFAPNHSKVDHCHRWQVADKALCQWLLSECGEGSHGKRLPDFIWQLSSRQLKIVYDALIAGDGTVDKRENRQCKTYFTASKELADDVQLLAISLGHRAHISGLTAGVYRVNITENQWEVQLSPYSKNRKANVERVCYNGKVYCFSVSPYHLFLTRRNGKIAIQGNTAEQGAHDDWSTIAPVANLVRDYYTYWLLWKRLGWTDLEFQWIVKNQDELKQAQIVAEMWNADNITVNEARKIYHRPPLPDGIGEMTKTAYTQYLTAAAQAAFRPEPAPQQQSGQQPQGQSKLAKGKQQQKRIDKSDASALIISPFGADQNMLSPGEQVFVREMMRDQRIAAE